MQDIHQIRPAAKIIDSSQSTASQRSQTKPGTQNQKEQPGLSTRSQQPRLQTLQQQSSRKITASSQDLNNHRQQPTFNNHRQHSGTKRPQTAGATNSSCMSCWGGSSYPWGLPQTKQPPVIKLGQYSEACSQWMHCIRGVE